MKIPVRIKNKILSLIIGLIAFFVVILAGIFGISEDELQNIENGKYTDYPFCVTFLDVGQGDCEIISCNGYNILIDGGEAENSGKILRYFEENDIEKLDCYILTHPHSDHIGVASVILSEIPCDKVFTTYFSEFNIPTTNVYERTLDAIYESGAEPVLVEAGDSFMFGDLKFDIIAPFVESEDYNAMSIVCKASYKDTSVLFTGDTTIQVEKQMLENMDLLDSDIIKIAHHGSSSSNSEEFIKAVSPEYAVISCGKNNTYGHPHKEVTGILYKNEIASFRTDDNGTLYYYGDGYDMTMEKSK